MFVRPAVNVNKSGLCKKLSEEFLLVEMVACENRKFILMVGAQAPTRKSMPEDV
jgi:hypothetical protein